MTFNNVSGIFLDFKILTVFVYYQMFFIICKNKCIYKLYSLHFSINNLKQNMESVYECPFRNPFYVSVINVNHCSFILKILEYIV